ncbi:MAG: type II toxin-antitoxin system HicA family toxin [Spirochaetia bacterium]
MNRRALEKHLRAHGCFLNHHGSRHDVWVNPRTQTHSPVPRHTTIKKATARGICKILGVPAPLGS